MLCVLINRDKYRLLVTNVGAPPRDNITLLTLTSTNGAHCTGLPFDLGGTTPRRQSIFKSVFESGPGLPYIQT